MRVVAIGIALLCSFWFGVWYGHSLGLGQIGDLQREVSAANATAHNLREDLDHYEKLRDTPDAEAWLRLCTAEMNVRYRDRVGDDGLRAEWAAHRDKCLEVYLFDPFDKPSQQVVDALYVAQVKITAKESGDVDKPAIDAVCDQMDRDIEAGTWPPEPVKAASDAELEQFRDHARANQ